MMEHDDVYTDEEIVLVDEEGVEHYFILVDVVMVDDVRYALLEPTDGDEDEGAYLFRIDEIDGEEQVVLVEDEEEFERVVSVLEDFVVTDGHEHGPHCNHNHHHDNDFLQEADDQSGED